MREATMSRRLFLGGTVASGALLGLGSRMALAAAESGKPEAGTIGDFKISLAEWSLHKALFAKKIDNLDFPKIAREDYGIEGVEFVNQFFKDKAHDSTYLKELKKRANDFGVTCVLIMIDGEGDLSATQDDKRERSAVENHKKWVDAAAALGCHAIRVNTGEHYSPTDVTAVAEACGMLDRLRRQERHLDHLRESRRAVQQSRRADRAHESRRQADLWNASRLRQLPARQSRALHDRHLRRDRPDDAVCQGRLGQELRFRRIRQRDQARLTPGS